MAVFIVGAIGFLAGLAAHDLAHQALTEHKPLRPLSGTCPRCGYRRGWLSLRCRNCGRRVGYEFVVAASAGLAAIAFAHTVGLDLDLVAYLGFVLLSTALVVTDLEAFRIVDRLNIPGTVVLALVLAAGGLFQGNTEGVVRSLLGGLAYFGGALGLYLAVRGRGFGGGDVKLAVQLGLFTAFVSWGTLGWAVVGTAVIGGVVSLTLLVAGAARRDSEVPYGPAMVLGTWAAIALAGVGAFPIPS